MAVATLVEFTRMPKGIRGATLRLAGWLAAAAVFIAAPAARAAGDTWTGSASGAWVTGSNWVGNQAPGNTTSGATATGDLATFNNAVNTTITVDSGRTVGGMTFATGAGGFTFRGSTLFLTGGAGTLSGTVSITGADAGSQTFYTDIAGGATNGTRNFTFSKGTATSIGSIYNFFGNITTGTGATVNVANFAGLSIATVRGVISNPAVNGTTSLRLDFQAPLVWLRGANTYAGTTQADRGMLIFDSVTNINSGSASSFGVPTTAANGRFVVGSTGPSTEQTFYYAGLTSGGHATDRAIFMQGAGNSAITAAGVGALTWTGSVTGTGSIATNQFILAGPSAAENRFGGVIADQPTQVMSLLKRGEGTWNLAGANTYTGTTAITSGLLRVDFANSGAVDSNIVNSSSPLVLGGGRLEVRAAAGESNSQSFNGTTFREGYGTITLVPGASGTASLSLGSLARGTLLSTTNALGSSVDFTPNGGTITTTGTTSNGVLTVGGVAFASVNKTDWATVNSGTIAALGSYQTATDPSTWASGSNVSLSGNPSANVSTGTINTLRLTASSTVTINSGNTLSLAAGGILASGNGGPMLIKGGTLRGSESATYGNRDLVILQHNTTSPLTIASPIANAASGTTSLTKGGDGVLELTGTNTFTGGITIGGGVLKISSTAALGNNQVKFGGGILGLAGGNITANTGSNAFISGTYSFAWDGSGGFAAYGADRTVTFDTTTASYFDMTTIDSAGAQRNGEFLLSAPDSDAKITIAMGAGDFFWISRTVSMPYIGTIRVSNGSAPVDAEISAPITVITGGTGRGGIQKMGAGVLQLSGSNTYNGPTIVAEGGLVVTGTNYNAMVTEVRGGAWLGGNGTITSLEVQSGGTVAPGARSGASSTIGTLSTTANAGNGYFLWNGSTNSAAQMAFQLSTTDNTSDRIDLGTDNFIKGGTSATSGTTFRFDFQNSGGKVGQTYTLVSYGTTSFTTANDFTYTNLGTYTGTFALTSSALTFTIPYLSTTYTLSGSASATVMRVGDSTSIGATVTNTGPNDQYDAVGFSGLAVTVSGGTLSVSPSSGTAAYAGSANGTGSFTSNTAGAYTLTPIVASATNVNLGTAATGSTSTFAVTVYNPAGANTLSNVTLGNVRVNDAFSTGTLSIWNTGTAAPTYQESLDAIGTSATGGASVSGTISNLLVTAGTSGAITVGLGNTATAGVRTGTVTLGFTSTGTANNVATGLAVLPLTSQTITVTGTVFNMAAANTIATPIDLGNVYVGGTFGTSALTISNTAPAGSFTEGLNASFGSATGFATNNSGTFTNLLAGSTNASSLVVGLGGSTNTGAAGVISGTQVILLASSGINSGLSDASLPSQTLSISGTVWTPAAVNAITSPVSIGNVHVGGTFGTSALSIANTAVSGSYTEVLGASAVTSGLASSSGVVTGLVGGGTSTSLSVGLGGAANTGSAGVKSGTATISFTSTGGPGTANIAAQDVAVTGTVWNYAAGSIVSGTTINFGAVLKNTPLSSTLSISNSAPTGFTEKLDAVFGSPTGLASGSGSFSLLAAGGTSQAMSVYLGSGSAGVATGTLSVSFTSNGSDTSGLGSTSLGSQTVYLSGTVLDPAVASFTSGSTTTSLSLDFGSVSQNAVVSPLAFDIYNILQTSGFTADLALVSITPDGGNTGALTTDLVLFNNLGPNTFNSWTASFSTANQGTFSNSWTLEFKSASGGTVFGGDTPQYLTLTAQGSVIVVPEPGAVALAAVGIGLAGLAARRRRRNGHAAEPARHGR